MADEDFGDMDTAQPVVRYSAKELFFQINRKLDVVLELVQGKASKEDLDLLQNRVLTMEADRNARLETWKQFVALVSTHGARIQAIEDRGSGRVEMAKIFAWVIGTSIAISGIVITYFVWKAGATH